MQYEVWLGGLVERGDEVDGWVEGDGDGGGVNRDFDIIWEGGREEVCDCEGRVVGYAEERLGSLAFVLRIFPCNSERKVRGCAREWKGSEVQLSSPLVVWT